MISPHSGRLPKEAIGPCALLLGAIAAFCWLLWPEWRQNPDLSHAFFAPLLFPLLLRESRLRGTPRWLLPDQASRFGITVALILGVCFFALAGLIAATLAWTHAVACSLLAASLGCFLFAGLLILADERWRLVPFNWISLTAILMWLLVSPMPNGTYTRITLGLQQWVTGSVLNALQVLGVPARQQGNIIELAATSVGVEEACSGIRSLISCTFAGVFFAGWLVRRPLGRMVLIVSAPLLALGMNFLRSLTLTLLANAGTNITGFWHDATGFAILGVTAAVLAGLAILFETKEPAPAAPLDLSPVSPPRPALRLFWTAIAGTLALGIFFLTSARPAVRQDVPSPSLAALLPATAANWEVITPSDLYRFTSILQTTHLLERTYLRRTGPAQTTQFTVYVAYWAPGQTSVSQVASHTPDACWPGSGWIAQAVPDSRGMPAMPGLRISPGEHRVFQNADGYPQNVWFWHIYDGRVINYRDPYSLSALLQIALQYGFRRAGEQYFVRVSSNKPWTELKDEPLVREIFTNLSRVGL